MFKIEMAFYQLPASMPVAKSCTRLRAGETQFDSGCNCFAVCTRVFDLSCKSYLEVSSSNRTTTAALTIVGSRDSD